MLRVEFVDRQAKMGRPTKYKPEMLALVRKVCRLGATDAEIADLLEVSIASVSLWKVEYPEFSEALIIGKDEYDDRIARSLATRALGYTFDSEKVFCSEGRVTRVAVREHVPPDVTACIFWLKNRRPAEFKERREEGYDPDRPLKIEVSGGLPTEVPPGVHLKIKVVE